MFTVPDEVARRLQAAATARGVAVDQVVVEALAEWTERHPAELPELSFVGIGEGRADLAEHHDEVFEAFNGCAASGRSEPFDIHGEPAAASAKPDPGATTAPASLRSLG
jgi:predicted transcriptional regulator